MSGIQMEMKARNTASRTMPLVIAWNLSISNFSSFESLCNSFRIPFLFQGRKVVDKSSWCIFFHHLPSIHHLSIPMIIIHLFAVGPCTYRLDREGTSRLPMDGQVVMGESRELRFRNWSSLISLQFHWPIVSDKM
jgi:hypothetical protein